ncbi:hypothetical protein FHW77_005366 [Agrobacterium sp. RC10-4-1]|uniref:hypothetical protein n=1 Tax=Agrobacterium sp. RC10-4-1 TaxID=2587039 RepID=UPI0015F800CB|nr:hypothetical protein [Agrobacterium sp. RC10-4-1]MBA8801610.1 hypothetical protein [Agrobacterium sp. RC10-4-1]MDP9773224.1 hypothetical protein [Rhizobium sp. SORGH_AS_0755]
MQSKVKAPDLADENDVSRVKSVESKPDLEPKATPWFQKWGTVSQITSALISFATLSVAVYGLSAASPFFKNKLLTEANAHLELESTALTKSIAEQKIALERMAADVRTHRLQGWNLAVRRRRTIHFKRIIDLHRKSGF